MLLTIRWDNVIGSSKELMSKFHLNLNCSEEYEDANELNRNHQKITVPELCAESLSAIRAFNLYELRVFRSQGRNLPMLKIFIAWEVKFEDDIADIQNFKRIRINIEKVECAAEVLFIFDCSTFKKIRLLWNHEMALEKKLQAYKLLSNQKNLQHFGLSEYPKDNFFHSPEIFLKFQFNLKSFQYISPASNLKYYKNIIRFLESQKNSLTKLDLVLQPSELFKVEEIQNYILDHMSNLKELLLDFHVRDEEVPEMVEKLQPTQVTKNNSNPKRKPR